MMNVFNELVVSEDQPRTNLFNENMTPEISSTVLFCSLVVFFIKKNWNASVFFVGPLMSLFWTSGDICPGFVASVRWNPQTHHWCNAW